MDYDAALAELKIISSIDPQHEQGAAFAQLKKSSSIDNDSVLESKSLAVQGAVSVQRADHEDMYAHIDILSSFDEKQSVDVLSDASF